MRYSQFSRTFFLKAVAAIGVIAVCRLSWAADHDHHHVEEGHRHELHHESSPGHDPHEQHTDSAETMTIHDAPASKPSKDAQGLRNPYEYSDGLISHERPIMGDEEWLGAVIVDRLESVVVRDDASMTYDWQAWYGKDYDKVLFRAEGELEQGTFKNARNEALWAHALTAYWDTQAGMRIDSGQGPDRLWAAFGVQGFAPYWVYIEATVYVGEEGRTAFRLETEYDILITQKLILQPRIEMNFYGKRDPGRYVSSGLSNMEAGLRLRYEIKREFAPYIGVEWASVFGSAADSIKSQGNWPEEARYVAGLHFWF